MQGQARDREREARLPPLAGDVRRSALGVPGREGRDAAALPLGFDLHEEPGVPRRDVRRGADRARDGEHDAGGDDRGVPGSRRGRADTITQGVDEAQSSCSSGCRGRRRLRRRRCDARGAKACRSSPTRSTSCSTGSAPSARARRRVSDGRDSSSGSGPTTRRCGRARTRIAGSAGSTRRCGFVQRVAELHGLRGGGARAVRRRRAARDGRLVARARGAPARVQRRVASTSSTRRIRPPSGGSRAASTWSARSSSPPRSRARRSRRARTSSISGSATGGRGAQFAAITDPGSELEQLAQRARLPRDVPGRARDRRPLLGALDVRDGAGRADGRRRRAVPRTTRREMVEACRLEDGQSGARARPLARRGLAVRARQGLRRRDPTGFGLWAEQLLAESTGKQGKGLVPAPGEPPDGPDRQRRRGAPPGPVRARAGVSPVGVRDRRRRSRARDQPVRPAGRAGGEGQDDRGARRRRAGPRSRAARSTSCSPRRATATTSRSRRSSTRRASASSRRSRERARETGCVVTSGLGPRYLHSTGQLHKGGPEHRALRPGRRRDRRGAADPRPRVRVRPSDPRAGGRRLRRARGAGQRVSSDMQLEEL